MKAVVLLVLLAATASPLADAVAAPVRLDPSFGPGGQVRHGTSAADAVAGMLVDTNGRIVVVGVRSQTSTQFPGAWAISRFTPGGGLDSSFTDFTGTTPLGNSSAGQYPAAIASDPSHRVLVVGTSDALSNEPKLAVIRYNENGSVDGSWDGDGVALYPLGARARAAALARNEGFVYGAASSADKALVVRFDEAGQLDTGYGVQGAATIAPPVAGTLAVQDMIALPGAGVVVGGTLNPDEPGEPDAFVVFRLEADGSLDESFGVHGFATTAFSPVDSTLRGLTVRPTGEIIAFGQTRLATAGGAKPAGAVAQYTAEGAQDGRYGLGGKTVTELPESGQLSFGDAVVLPTGQLVLGGNARIEADSESQFAVVRLSPTGMADAGMGPDRVVTGPFHTGASISSLALTDGAQKVVGAGIAGGTSTSSDWALARYLLREPLDPGLRVRVRNRRRVLSRRRLELGIRCRVRCDVTVAVRYTYDRLGTHTLRTRKSLSLNADGRRVARLRLSRQVRRADSVKLALRVTGKSLEGARVRVTRSFTVKR